MTRIDEALYRRRCRCFTLSDSICEQGHDFNMLGLRSQVKRSLAVGVFCIRIGSGVQEHFNYLDVAVSGSHVEGRFDVWHFQAISDVKGQKFFQFLFFNLVNLIHWYIPVSCCSESAERIVAMVPVKEVLQYTVSPTMNFPYWSTLLPQQRIRE